MPSLGFHDIGNYFFPAGTKRKTEKQARKKKGLMSQMK
jgi:hypothetical protein